MKRLAVLLAVTAVLTSGCSLLSPAEETLIPVEAGEITTDPGIGLTVIPPDERGEPLDIAGTDLDGNELSLADSRGDITVVNAWATWCAPCRAEKPEFTQVARDFEDQGVTFVGINVQDEVAAAQEFTADTPYRSIIDPDGSLLAQVPDVPPRALPVTVILDREGRVAVRIVGPIVLGTLANTVNSVLADEATRAG
ncbi:MAG TPA: TlpA disulfide reductase family protein [Candidatus Nanopelagicales bacterium]|nr:TlpA disulfide reductase family protein [Candidatus Nanopelagicales bacterium]